MHTQGREITFTEEDKVTDDKYVVFKLAEFSRFVDGLSMSDQSDIPDPLQDATVIRGQDLFAAPALDTYATSIGIAIKVMSIDDPRRDYLQSVADYFHRRADESRGIAFKTPDNGGH